jgi:hypothetical protein
MSSDQSTARWLTKKKTARVTRRLTRRLTSTAPHERRRSPLHHNLNADLQVIEGKTFADALQGTAQGRVEVALLIIREGTTLRPRRA